MPSPVGHALGGIACGWLAAAPAREATRLRIQIGTFAALGMAPDLDLVFGHHRAESHSLGLAMIAALSAAAVRWPVAHERWRIGLAVLCAWMSHPLLDSLALDPSSPVGIMAFWPFTRRYFVTGLSIFLPVGRDIGAPTFLHDTVVAVLREAVIMIPVAGLVYWARGGAGFRRPAK
jgi:membrane-bound metal-dependent hydrolase YbcI (DUF457 family)